MTGYSEAQKRATKKYVSEHYDEIKIRIPKGQKDVLRERAESEGKSLNQYVVDRLNL